ncbi:hypothetical protein FY148_00600 [Agrobacterium tumefaciens]|uniref:hypothetical protein n=1 Tax=Agrobacterium tumefaciens TaxID=358 RepID=UPI0021CEE5FD|nr:hypothetical protein [Agrobacterium tumefaciens]UXS51221.1 hypothetical protein FY148_00600 [Agrobacterium tumefaciens]UXS61468.1 hypothetical protein FY147_00600 [Agrobacterium tumefaciens]
MILIAAHIILASALFKLVNWIGEHATDFGYASTTLFEEPNESLALNFFIRALAPAVFMLTLSAAAVAAGHADLRIGIYWIAIYYYALRVIYILAMNMHRLVSWPRFAIHSGVGLMAAWLVYQNLILPSRSLLPNLETAGNELWLAIFAFLYAAANKVTVSGGPGAKRRNDFIKRTYNRAEFSYGTLINDRISDDQLQLITYAILIYENYCRPPSVRTLERLCLWKQRTTGIMQVASSTALSDEESVKLGAQKLSASWQRFAEENLYERTVSTVTDYNKDSDYLLRVFEVMEIIAKRAAPRFLPAYNAIMGSIGYYAPAHRDTDQAVGYADA